MVQNLQDEADLGHEGEVLAKSTSVHESLQKLQAGTFLWKLRDKGIRGLVLYRRKYHLSMADLIITYHPNKGIQKSPCAGGIASSTSMDLSDIAEIRFGHSTDAFNAATKTGGVSPVIDSVKLESAHCFSIIFKDNRCPLDLIAENQGTRDMWVDTLSHLLVTIRSLGEQKEYEMFLKKQFQNADKNKSGNLTLDECKSLVEQLNLKMDKRVLRDLFNKANVSKSSKKGEAEFLDESEFIEFYYSLLKRPELEKVFSRYAKAEGKMSPEDLRDFMLEEQKVELAPEECQKLIEAFEPTLDRKALTSEGFTHFMMFSEWHEIVDSTKKNQVYQDMTQPLAHYWLASSHNTYLTGNQVTGDSSVDGYISALKKGCRCVELDCWDGDDGEPIIYHGWTLTTKIFFKEVIQDAILPYAFCASSYPLILSIENHCSLEQQDKMADYLKTILGPMLYAEPVDEERTALPSPEELQKKVLIKAKKLPKGKSQDEVIASDENDDNDERDEKKKKSAKKISQKLSDLVNYIEAVHFDSFEDSKENGKFFQMSSFGESKAKDFFKDPTTSAEFVRYNMKQISRIYPSGTRQDSSNLDVIDGWNSGCQIVALNYQTDDKQNLLNSARFLDNGQCGFVLKPEFMRDPSIHYSPVSPAGLDKKKFPAWKIELTVVSGQHIPKADGSSDGEVIDPYVKVRIRGHPDDDGSARHLEAGSEEKKSLKNKAKTDKVRNNGFNPIWNERFHFEVRVPSLAFLEVRVKDHSKSGRDYLLGAFCAPLTMIQQGYRRVPLFDLSGRDLSPATILLHVLIKEIH